MRYLVTGAAGFLGYYIARRLAEEADVEVIVVDNFIRGENDKLYRDLCARQNVHSINMDLTDQAAVGDLPDHVDIIFHMAALNGTQNFYERPFEVVRCCTLPTVFLIEKYGPLGLQRFVYAGTSESYAGTVTRFGWEVPTGEDVPLAFDDIMNERWSYGASKMHGEVATINGCRHYDIPFTVARFHNAYGPRMGDKHVVPDFLTRARAGRFELNGFEDTRSFIYAEDAARATIALSRAQGAVNEIVNVGGDQEISILELGKAMMSICQFHQEIALFPSPKGSVKRRAPRIDKLRRLTGYAPEWTLEDGLRETAAYYLA
jgi:nucleoside-diphosphate-sugar epimerase